MTMRLDPTRIELLDLDPPADGTPYWTGTVDEFLVENRSEMSDDQIERLHEQGAVVIGGGAAPMVCVRFALAEPIDWSRS
jgi:hypothetical protein